MQKRIAVVLVIILFIVVGLCGCSNQNNEKSEENRFVGTWEYGDGEKIIFFSDGTISSSLFSGYYEIKDNKLVMTIGDLVLVGNYYFSDNDTILTVTNINTGSITVYTKV